MNLNAPKFLFRVTQKALIKKDGLLLVLKRAMNEKSFPGLWDLPGGRLEQGENLNQSLLREVKEETNFEIKVLDLIFAFSSEVKNGFAVYLAYNVDVLSGEIKLCYEDHSEYAWVTKEELLKLEVTPVLKYGLENCKIIL
jgi:8-oxo-dGTP diphosphatase